MIVNFREKIAKQNLTQSLMGHSHQSHLAKSSIPFHFYNIHWRAVHGSDSCMLVRLLWNIPLNIGKTFRLKSSRGDAKFLLHSVKIVLDISIPGSPFSAISPKFPWDLGFNTFWVFPCKNDRYFCFGGNHHVF